MNRKTLSLNLPLLSAAALSLMLGSTTLLAAGQETQQRGMGENEQQWSTQQQGMGEGQSSNFSNLDQDQDGYISQKEAQDSHTLSSKFKELDQNRDQKLDQSEFSAFEGEQKGTQQSQPYQQRESGGGGYGGN